MSGSAICAGGVFATIGDYIRPTSPPSTQPQVNRIGVFVIVYRKGRVRNPPLTICRVPIYPFPKILEFTADKNCNDLDNDERLSLAIIRLFEIIGEVGNSVTKEYQNNHPEILWSKLIALRNRLFHGQSFSAYRKHYDVNVFCVTYY